MVVLKFCWIFLMVCVNFLVFCLFKLVVGLFKMISDGFVINVWVSFINFKIL